MSAEGSRSPPYLLLIRSHLRQWLRQRSPRTGRTILGAAALLGFVPLLYLGLLAAFTHVAASGSGEAATVLLPLLFPLVAMILLLRGVGASVQQLYLARDLDFLLLAPVPSRSIFLLKASESAIPVSLWAMAVQLPALTAYGHAVGAPASFFAASVVLTTFMVLGAVLPSMTLVMTLARFVPKRRLPLALGLVPLVQVIAIVLLLTGIRRSDPSEAGGFVRIGRRAQLLPTRYLADALQALEHGQWHGLAVTAGVGGVATVVLGFFAYRLFCATVRDTWNALKEAPARRTSTHGHNVSGRLRRQPGPIRVMVLKELRSWTRDLRHVAAQLVPLATVGMIALYAARRAAGASGTQDPAAAFWQGLQIVPLGIYLVAQPTFGAFSREGPSFELIRMAPVNGWQLLFGKTLSNVVPALLFAIGVVTAVAMISRPPGSLVVAALTGVSWLAVGSVAASVAAASTTTAVLHGTARRPPVRVLLTGAALNAFFLWTSIAALYWLYVRSRDQSLGTSSAAWVGLLLLVAVGLSCLAILAVARAGSNRLLTAQP